MTENTSTEKLYKYQQEILFLAILLFPIQTIIFFQKSFVSTFSFYGQISSIPLLFGFVLAVLTCLRECTVKKLLFPILAIAVFYVLLLACISLHSIFEYANIGTFDAATFGETPKTRLLKNLLEMLGVSNDVILYGMIVFMRDTLNSVREVMFAFGTVMWIAFLSRKDYLGTFKTVRTAVLWSTLCLTPYIVCEVMHLYGMEGATAVLKTINSSLYEPCSFLGWYPPLVSSNQIRGTWTEPAFFAIWLAFATPFLVSYFFEGRASSLKSTGIGFIFFTVLFSIWFMTYARTSVVLISVLLILYIFFAIVFCSRENWRKAGILMAAAASGILIVSTWGQQEGSHQILINSTEIVAEKSAQEPPEVNVFDKIAQKNIQREPTESVLNSEEKSMVSELRKIKRSISKSTLIKDSINSSIDAKSRSNPTRLEDFNLKIEIFEMHPIVGVGDTFASFAQTRKMQQGSNGLTEENQQRLSHTKSNGLFQSAITGFSLSIAGVLACRGLLGFSIVFVPILFLGLVLFVFLFKVHGVSRQVGTTIFISCFASFLPAFSQGLWYYYFWCSMGLAVAFVFRILKEYRSRKNDIYSKD